MSEMKPIVAVDYADDDIVVVRIDREKILEEKDIQILEETILPIIEENEPPKMVIDFCKVDYLSSSVLGLLIRLDTMIKDRGGDICLCNISERIYGIFKITRLDKVFSVFDDSEKAISHLKNK